MPRSGFEPATQWSKVQHTTNGLRRHIWPSCNLMRWHPLCLHHLKYIYRYIYSCRFYYTKDVLSSVSLEDRFYYTKDVLSSVSLEDRFYYTKDVLSSECPLRTGFTIQKMSSHQCPLRTGFTIQKMSSHQSVPWGQVLLYKRCPLISVPWGQLYCRCKGLTFQVEDGEICAGFACDCYGVVLSLIIASVILSGYRNQIIVPGK